MAEISLAEQRLRRVELAFASLPQRYLGRGPEATVEIRLGDVGRAWEVSLAGECCRIFSPPRGTPDVVIGTDAHTWLALREGRLSGLDAFARRRLRARGDLELALAFEGLFRLPDGRPPLLRVHRIETRGPAIMALTAAGGGEHVICLHGLGATKSSFFETVAALAPEHTVHALDLPGFGSSDKPARAPYDAPWFARAVERFMDAMEIRAAHLVGNSMGGRIAIEVAMQRPTRVSSLSLLAPALAFRRRRELVPLVRLLRPELAAIPHPLRADRVHRHLLDLFAQPERLDPAAAEIAADEFRRSYRSRGARIAFYASARSIYLDQPWGEQGFWTRLGELRAPALFVWGAADRLVPAAFARHVSEALPAARQVVLDDCGHVPQIEVPGRTNSLIGETIASASDPVARRGRPAALARPA